MPPAQKPAGAEGAERALPREKPVTADAATPTPANKGSASAAGAEVITMGNDDLLAAVTQPLGGLCAAVTQLSEIIAGARNNLLAPRDPWNLDPSDFLADPFGKM